MKCKAQDTKAISAMRLILSCVLVLSFALSGCEDSSESKYVPPRKDYWGCIDEKGNWIIEPEYDLVRSFTDDGLTIAVVEDVGQGIYDESGTLLVSAEEGFRFGNFIDGIASARQNDRTGLVNKDMEWILEPLYKDIEWYSTTTPFPAQDLETELWGYIDLSGAWIIEPQFNRADDFAGEYAWVEEVEWHKQGIINKAGEWVIEPKYERIYSDLSETIPACALDPETGLIGYLDISGKWVIEPQFKDYSVFAANGLCPQKSKETDLYGCLDTSGNWIIEPHFLWIGSFDENGIAVAGEVESERYGFIDTSGKWILEPAFDRLRPFGANGLAGAVDESVSSEFGFINKQGEWVIEPQFATVEPFQKNGIAAVSVYADE